MQFSIRAILALTLVCGGICGLMFGVPDEYVAYGLLAPWAVLPGALIALLVYGRGYVRAFAIGAMPIAIPSSMCALFVCLEAGSMSAESAQTMRIIFVVGAAIVFLAGTTSAAIRWVLLPRATVRPAKAQAEAPTGAISPEQSELAPPVEHAIGPIFAGRFRAPSEMAEPRGPFEQRSGTVAPRLEPQTALGELHDSPGSLPGKQT
jgi:hypothetical protein